MKEPVIRQRFAVSNMIPASWTALLRHTPSLQDILSKTDPEVSTDKT